jgi:hypothetical protein
MALSNSTFTDFGSSVGDIFAGIGDEYKAQGEQFEEERYTAPQRWQGRTRNLRGSRLQSNKLKPIGSCL